MSELPQQARNFFVKAGQRGGFKRARRLTASQRYQIASKAAQARWQKSSIQDSAAASVRLDAPAWHDPVYLEEVLSEGALTQWRILYQKVCDHPFGEVAQALTLVLAHVHEYGISPLWKGIMRTAQGHRS